MPAATEPGRGLFESVDEAVAADEALMNSTPLPDSGPGADFIKHFLYKFVSRIFVVQFRTNFYYVQNLGQIFVLEFKSAGKILSHDQLYLNQNCSFSEANKLYKPFFIN
jgi:hypothetical protein